MKFVRGEIRQGDVALVRVEGDIPANWKECRNDDGLVTLALGEATGHHHSFRYGRAALFRPDDMSIGGIVAVPTGGDTLTHQEHAEMVVPSGLYMQAVQVEETPEAVRTVVD